MRSILVAAMLAGCAAPAPPVIDPSPSVAPEEPEEPALLKGTCLDGDLEGCTARCDQNDMESCVRLGRIHHEGDTRHPKNELKARAAYNRACRNEVGKACYLLAVSYEHGAAKDSIRASELMAKSIPMLTEACDGTDGESCLILADLYLTGNGVAQDEAKDKELRARATDLLRKACEGGDPSSCPMAGAGVLLGAEAGNRDYPLAATLWQKGCDGGDASSCAFLASAYEKGMGVEEDPKKAAALRKRACDGGLASACASK